MELRRTFLPESQKKGGREIPVLKTKITAGEEIRGKRGTALKEKS